MIKIVNRDTALDQFFCNGKVYVLRELTAATPLITLNNAIFAVEELDLVEDDLPFYEEMEQEELKPEEKIEEILQNMDEPAAPKKASAKKQLDHGKIIALYKAGWSVAKIADEMGCSDQTVRNHLKAEEDVWMNGHAQC